MPTGRSFYPRAALYLSLGLVFTLIGFFPTYFAKLRETDALHHFHGITGTLWMAVLVIQPLIYRFGDLKYHRIVGWISIGLAPFVFYGGLRVVQFMMQTREPSTLLYQFAWIDLWTVVPFVLFVGLGVAYRKKTQLHARYMVCTVFGPLSAGVVRVFQMILQDWNQALTASFILFEVILLVLIWDDQRGGRIRAPYPLCLGIFVFTHILVYFVGDWPWWQNLTQQLAQINF